MKIISSFFILISIITILLLVANTHQQQTVFAQQYNNAIIMADHQEQQQDEQTARIYSQAIATRSVPSHELQALPVSRLRRFLGERGADCDGCREKHDLVQRAVEVMTWPTRDDAVAAELSLEQDLMGPLANDLSIPIGEDRSIFQDQYDDETIQESPSARSSVKPLTDAEVVALLEIHRMRTLIAEGIARCGPRHFNGTQYCQPTAAIITREVE